MALDDHRFQCLCLHVHPLTLIVAIVGIVLCVASTVSNIVTVQPGGYYTSSIVSIICYILLIVGNRMHSRFFYWPFFIVNTLSIIGFFILSIFLFILAAAIAHGDYIDGLADKDRPKAKTGAIVVGIVYIIIAIIQIFFMVIVYRDYKYVRELQLCPPVHHHTGTAVVYAQQYPQQQYPQQAYPQQYPPPQVIQVDSHHNSHHCD